MLRAHGLTLYEPGDLADLPATPEATDLRQISVWANEFLNMPHRDLGRSGSVCPYTRTSMENRHFFLAWAGAEGEESVESTAHRYREWFSRLLEHMDSEQSHLLAMLIVFPAFDRADADQLDALQGRLKDTFVEDGLMVGQFHPVCGQGGLWNMDFRPLRAPIPLLAIRRMVSSDLPFLLDKEQHLTAYLRRFAPDIPSHVRRVLVTRAVGRSAASRPRTDNVDF